MERLRSLGQPFAGTDSVRVNWRELTEIEISHRGKTDEEDGVGVEHVVRQTRADLLDLIRLKCVFVIPAGP